MLAAEAQINRAASNIANLNTPGYKAGGPLNTNPLTPPINPSGQDGSNRDLASQVVQLDRASILYDANAAVIRSTSRMTGALLDMFAPRDDS